MKLEELLEFPSSSFTAGRDLPDDEFEKFADIIISEVSKLASLCYYAGKEWNDARFDRYADQIISKVANHTTYSFLVGRDWNDERFDRCAEQIMVMTLSTFRFTDAFKEWKPERFEKLEEYRAKSYGFPLETIKKIERGYKMTFWRFVEQFDPELVIKIPIQDFYNAAEAYAFARQVEREDSFFNGLKESIEKGTVSKWAKTIIEYFRETSKGAGNYRMIEVAA